MYMQKKALVLAISSIICSGAYAQTDATNVQTLGLTKVKEAASEGRSVTEGSAISVGKMDVSLKETPRSVVVLEEKFLKDSVSDDVGNVFDYVAGFNKNSSADRRFTARGISTDISNVLVDGMRTLQGGEAGSGSRFASTYNAESISFLRGGDGTLYGAGLGGGLINVITKKAQAEQETTIGLSTRSYVSSDTDNFQRNGLGLNLSSTGKLTQDDSVLYLVNAQLSPDRQMFADGQTETDNFFDASLVFNLENSVITAKYEHGDQDRVGGSSYGDGIIAVDGDLSDTSLRGNYYGSPDDYGRNKFNQFTVRVDHEFNKQWKGFAAIRFNETDSDTEDLYATNSAATLELADGTEIRVENLPTLDSAGRTIIGRKWVKSAGEDTYKAFDANIEGKFELGSTKHHIIAGVNYLDSEVLFARSFQSGDAIIDAIYGTGGSPIDVYNPDHYQVIGEQPEWDLSYSTTADENLNIYVRDRISFGDFTLIAGLGYADKDGYYENGSDVGDSSDDGFLYDLGGIYKVNENINVFANYSRAFEFVSSSDAARYGQGKNFDAIEGDNYEIGVKGDFLDGKISAGATIFSLSRVNETSRDTVDGVQILVQDSGKNAKSKGIEIETVIRATEDWIASISYAYTDAESLFTNGDERKWGGSDYAPKNSFAIWNTYQVNDKWSVDLGMHYDSKYYDFGSLDDSGDISVRNTFDSKFEVDTGVTYQEEQWKARLVVKNLFDDSRIYSGTSLQQLKVSDPRSVNFSIDYTF